ncbi:14233_t:CDS:2, partial [Funneliformis geosporum]
NLSKSYLEHFESKVALLNRKVDFYNFIAYTILGDKQGLIQLKVHVGNIVELSEESEDTSLPEKSIPELCNGTSSEASTNLDDEKVSLEEKGKSVNKLKQELFASELFSQELSIE